jgi:integrase
MSIRTIEPLEELKLLAHLDIPHAVKDEFGLSTIDLDRSLLNWKRRRNIVAFLIMLDAGLRVGEVISLSISDCYACSHPVRTLTIRGPLSRKGSDRDIPVSPRLYRALEYLTPENLLIPDRPSPYYPLAGAYNRRGLFICYRSIYHPARIASHFRH